MSDEYAIACKLFCEVLRWREPDVITEEISGDLQSVLPQLASMANELGAHPGGVAGACFACLNPSLT